MVEAQFTPWITYVILAITVFISYKAFEDYSLKRKFLFTPYLIKHNQEWYRMFSHGVIHADWTHLLLNAFVLYSFGTVVETMFFYEYGPTQGRINYLLLYVGGIVVSVLYSFAKHQDNPGYNALGASGAVSAVLYSSIIMNPNATLGLYMIIPIRAWIFGLLYLGYSHYMAKKGMDNIGHDAHIGGALFGVAITIFYNPDYLVGFFDKIFQFN